MPGGRARSIRDAELGVGVELLLQKEWSGKASPRW